MNTSKSGYTKPKLDYVFCQGIPFSDKEAMPGVAYIYGNRVHEYKRLLVLVFQHTRYESSVALFLKKSCCVSSACVYSEHRTAGEPGAVAGVSGWWRVEGV